jgi:hypothetical protein
MIRRLLRTRPPALVAVLVLLAGGALAQTVPPPPSRPFAPAAGDVVPTFESLSIDGSPRKVDFPAGSETVLLIFSAGCPHCQRMIPEWNRAYGRKPKELRVLGVLTDRETPGFWQTFSVTFPVVRSPVPERSQRPPCPADAAGGRGGPDRGRHLRRDRPHPPRRAVQSLSPRERRAIARSPSPEGAPLPVRAAPRPSAARRASSPTRGTPAERAGAREAPCSGRGRGGF